MVYPELDINEFAKRYSADVNLERDETGYRVTVDVDYGDEEFPAQLVLRPKTVDQLSELYQEHFSDIPTDGLVGVYGNSDSVIGSMRGSDSWGVFEKPVPIEEFDSVNPRKWAVNIEPLIADTDRTDYEEIMEEISAATLYSVNRAESLGEVGPGLMDFHRDLIREFSVPGSEPIVIDVVEKPESDEYAEVSEDSEPEETVEQTFDYEGLVSSTIPESKKRIEEIEEDLDDDDWEALLEAERENKDRKTFKPYLEERLEQSREDT